MIGRVQCAVVIIVHIIPGSVESSVTANSLDRVMCFLLFC